MKIKLKELQELAAKHTSRFPVMALIEDNRRLVKALRVSCCCPGENDYDGKEIKCDACETLARASERLGVKT